MVKRSAVQGTDRGTAKDTVQGTRECPVEQVSKEQRLDRGPRPAGRPPASHPGEAPARKSRAALARHSRRCNVCKHPDRDAIEQEFLRWRSPDDIAEDYGIAHHSSIYRHVHATGIFARRRKTIRLALEPLLERAYTVKVTGNAIVNAARVYAQINDAGEWVRPAKTVIIHHVPAPAAPPSEPERGNPNGEIRELDHAPTR